MGQDQRGYAMAALLVAMSVMAIMMSIALPVWNTAARREREEELIFRGQQYARAIALFQRRYPGTFPPNVDVLLNEKFLRKRYTDPMTDDGDFQLIPLGAPIPGQGPPAGSSQAATQAQTQAQLDALARQTGGLPGQGRGPVRSPFPAAQQPGLQVGIMGVVSRSTAQSFRLYNGRDRYNEWAFIATQASTQAGSGAEGTPVPGAPGRGGPPGQRGRGGQQNPGGRGAQPPPPGRGRF
jgi:type II secretory pathway pseudopilin PulG